MPGHLFIAPGDLTQLSADAIAFSANNGLRRHGNLHPAFEARFPDFAAFLTDHQPRPGDHYDVGTTFWMPLADDRKPHGIVVVVSTGEASTSADKAAVAVRAALNAAVKGLRRAGRKGRLLIALPTFRVGMGGDQRQRLRSARVQVEAAVEALGRWDDVDAAFVAYTPTLYRIFLEARRQVQGGPPPTDPNYPILEAALRAGEGVLFAGAGLSFGAGLPDWNGLIARLKSDLGLPADERVDHLDLAQWYRERFGQPALCEVLRGTYADPQPPPLPTLAHYLLLGLPFRHVITTNYDDLAERTLSALKRHPIRVVQQQDVARTSLNEGVYVVKLHGDARRPEDVVLARDDYEEFFHRRPAMALLLESLLLTRVFFFVGYGLRDPNFRQVWARIAHMLTEARRPAFATSFEISGQSGVYLAEQWRHKGLFLIEVPGATQQERETAFLVFLDRLADRVLLGQPGLFLAPDADTEAAPRLRRLRTLLVEEVGQEAARLATAELDGEEATRLAEVLTFLTRLGWRPPLGGGQSLSRLWEALAERVSGDPARQRLLINALEYAETFADVERIRKGLGPPKKP